MTFYDELLSKAAMRGGAHHGLFDESSAVVPDSFQRKQFHEMSRAEYEHHTADKRLRVPAHEPYVREALKQGKPVPSHVLADYPHLIPVSAPKPKKVRIVHTQPISSLSLFDESLHPRAQAETVSSTSGKTIKPGQFAPKPESAEPAKPEVAQPETIAVGDFIKSEVDNFKTGIVTGMGKVGKVDAYKVRTANGSADVILQNDARLVVAYSQGKAPPVTDLDREVHPVAPGKDALKLLNSTYDEMMPLAGTVENAEKFLSRVDALNTAGIKTPRLKSHLKEAINEGETLHKEQWQKLVSELSSLPEWEDTEDEAETEPVAKKPAAVSKTPYSISADHAADLARMRDGKITPEELRTSFNRYMDNIPAVKAELEALKVPELRNSVGMMARSNSTKRELVDSLINRGMAAYAVGRPVSYSPFSETYEDGVRRVVGKVDQSDIDTYAAERRKAAEERAVLIAARRKALENPETWDEFQTYLRWRSLDKMPLDMRRRYDDLVAEQEKPQKQAVSESSPSPASSFDGGMDIVTRYHDKRGKDVHIVTMPGRVDRDEYEQRSANAKSLGGWYSRAWQDSPAGFAFPDKDNAEKFKAQYQRVSPDAATAPETVGTEEIPAVESAGPAKRSADKLRSVADSMIAKSDESIGRDRQVNTARRARMAGSAEADAFATKRMAQTMLNIAAAIESGEANHLSEVRTRTQIETLDHALRAAHHRQFNERQSAQGGRYIENGRPVSYEDWQHRHVDESAINNASYPYPALHCNELRQIASVLSRPGTRMLGNRLRAMADRMVGGGSHYASIQDEKEIADYKEGLKTAELALPSYSRNTMKARTEDYDRLQAVGVKSLPSLRAALREYLPLRAKSDAPDPIREAERALAGRKIDGYFPTPPTLVARMLDEAGIQPGDAVLEPSAGKGNIADAIRKQHPESAISAIEPHSDLRTILESKGHSLVERDFLSHNGKYDKIVMNPPFENGQDMAHVQHAFESLNPGGRLVAIMSEGPFFRQDAKASSFRSWLETHGGTSEQNANGTFMSSERPTCVATRLVVMDKPATDDAIEKALVYQGGAFTQGSASADSTGQQVGDTHSKINASLYQKGVSGVGNAIRPVARASAGLEHVDSSHSGDTFSHQFTAGSGVSGYAKPHAENMASRLSGTHDISPLKTAYTKTAGGAEMAHHSFTATPKEGFEGAGTHHITVSDRPDISTKVHDAVMGAPKAVSAAFRSGVQSAGRTVGATKPPVIHGSGDSKLAIPNTYANRGVRTSAATPSASVAKPADNNLARAGAAFRTAMTSPVSGLFKKETPVDHEKAMAYHKAADALDAKHYASKATKNETQHFYTHSSPGRTAAELHSNLAAQGHTVGEISRSKVTTAAGNNHHSYGFESIHKDSGERHHINVFSGVKARYPEPGSRRTAAEKPEKQDHPALSKDEQHAFIHNLAKTGGAEGGSVVEGKNTSGEELHRHKFVHVDPAKAASELYSKLRANGFQGHGAQAVGGKGRYGFHVEHVSGWPRQRVDFSPA